MRGVAMVVIAALACLVVSGCAYKPLKAPCAPDEDDQPLSYSETPPTPEQFRALDACGPMKPI